MQIPKSICVLGRTYSVIQKERDINAFGLADYRKQRILIDSRLKLDTQGTVLLHELLHVLSSSLDINLKERDVCSLASGIFDTITRNKIDFNDFLGEKES